MPNPMNIVPPVPGTTPGPAWAQDINDILETQVAPHDHTGSPNGVQLTQDALAIDDNLTLNNNALLDVTAVELSPFSSTFLGSLFRQAADLYYKDGAGNDVRITQGGALAASSIGSITGLAGTDGTASFAGLSTFRWRKYDVGGIVQWASMENANVKVYNGTATNPAGAVNIVNPHVLTSDKTLTLSPENIGLPQTIPAAGTFRNVQINGNGTMGLTGAVSKAALASTLFTNAGVILGSASIVGSGRPILITIEQDGPVGAMCLWAKNAVVAATQNSPINFELRFVLTSIANPGGIIIGTGLYRVYDPIIFSNLLGGVKIPPSNTYLYQPLTLSDAQSVSVSVVGVDLNTALTYDILLDDARLVLREV